MWALVVNQNVWEFCSKAAACFEARSLWIKPSQHGITMKFLVISAWLHMYVIDENTFIIRKQESPVCFRIGSNGSDNTLEGFKKAEGESGNLSVLFHLSCSLCSHLRCCCPFLLQVTASVVDDAHTLKAAWLACGSLSKKKNEIHRN